MRASRAISFVVGYLVFAGVAPITKCDAGMPLIVETKPRTSSLLDDPLNGDLSLEYFSTSGRYDVIELRSASRLFQTDGKALPGFLLDSSFPPALNPGEMFGVRVRVDHFHLEGILPGFLTGEFSNDRWPR